MAHPQQWCTVGVYGFTGDWFLDCLTAAGVGRVVDVRQRRGVRGRDYAWANARRLQAALSNAGIAYLHRRDLAPTTELRHLQYAADARLGVGKRSRERLAVEYVARYRSEILARADLGSLLVRPGDDVVALLCVERNPAACHRSLIAARLAADHGVVLTHLVPG